MKSGKFLTLSRDTDAVCHQGKLDVTKEEINKLLKEKEEEITSRREHVIEEERVITAVEMHTQSFKRTINIGIIKKMIGDTDPPSTTRMLGRIMFAAYLIRSLWFEWVYVIRGHLPGTLEYMCTWMHTWLGFRFPSCHDTLVVFFYVLMTLKFTGASIYIFKESIGGAILALYSCLAFIAGSYDNLFMHLAILGVMMTYLEELRLFYIWSRLHLMFSHVLAHGDKMNKDN